MEDDAERDAERDAEDEDGDGAPAKNTTFSVKVASVLETRGDRRRGK